MFLEPGWHAYARASYRQFDGLRPVRARRSRSIERPSSPICYSFPKIGP